MSELVKPGQYKQFMDEWEVAIKSNSVDLPIKHYFTPGMYLREVFVPAGYTLSSQIHKTTHSYIVSCGVINIIDGNQISRVIAPYTGETKKGTRRIGFAVEDCIWTTCHVNPDNCTDLNVLEKRLFKQYQNPLLKSVKRRLIK